MNKEMVDVLTRTGPGTPMGDLMRRYWVPALLSSELPEADCPQVRVKLLGERLIAFRDTQGRIGLIDEFCPHRGVSLFLGRNEENGLRCSYHGWKFDVDGHCVELPSVPHLAPKMKTKSYPVRERGGIVWAYMGPADTQPDLPELEWALLDEPNRYITKRYQATGYLQAMEGGIDTTHASWVHRFELDKDPMHRHAEANKYIKADRNAVFDLEESSHGLTIFGRRNGEPDSYYWRVTQWIFPWYTLIPPFGPHALGGHMWIPIDDESCWSWSINYLPDRPLPEEELEAMRDGQGIHYKAIPGTFVPVANPSNDWLIDRRAQKNKESFSGVEGFSIQDASLQESMGPIQNYAGEHLVATDRAIAAARRILYKAATDLAAGGDLPALKGVDQRIRAASVLLPREQDIREWAREALTDGLNKPVYSV
jgi:nitrite reductase/ring-hydroxylating ferredoxin subunit